MADDGYERLFAQVMACPEADEPRWVLADYLEERADPRAEFIRVQCELARTDRRSREYYELSERSDQLLAEHQSDWMKALPECIRMPFFRRGFVHQATITAKPLVKEPAALTAAPFDWIRLNRLKAMGEAIAGMAELKALRGLDLSTLVIPLNDLAAVLESPHLSSLQQLDLTGVRSEMGAAAGKALARAVFRPTLKSFTFHHVPDDDFWPAFGKGGPFPELRELALGMEHQPIDQWLEKFVVPKLERLLLRGATLSEGGLKGLLAFPLPQIRRLDLRGIALTETEVTALADQGVFDDVIELDVTNHTLTVDAVKAIFSRRVDDCCRLRMAKTRELSQAGRMRHVIETLANTPFQKLDHLEMSFLNDAGLVGRLLQSESFQSLRSLRLEEVAIGREDIAALCAPMVCRSLRTLRLVDVQFHDEAFEDLDVLPELLVLDLSAGHHRWEFPMHVSESLLVDAISSGKLPSLRELHLNETGLTDLTMKAVASCPHLSELRMLSFTGNRTSDDAVHAVLQSECLPKLQVVRLNGTKGMKNRPKLRQQYGERLRV